MTRNKNKQDLELGMAVETRIIKIGNTMVEFNKSELVVELLCAIPIINTFFTLYNPTRGNLGLYYFNQMKEVYHHMSDDVINKIEDALTVEPPKQLESLDSKEAKSDSEMLGDGDFVGLG